MLGFTDEGAIRNGFSAEQEIRMLEADQKELAVTFASLGLSIAGLITGFGEAADAANAALFYSTGHPILGTLSGLSALPIPVIEQALGLTVGACLLVKVVWIGGKIIKNAVVIASKTKLAKPIFMMCQKTGRFFQCTYEKGKAIILISYELDEVLALADTIAIINKGEIVENKKVDQLNRNEIGLLMAGKKANKN